jgi:ribosome-associated toxin RatA of RatAB toxin-antitoxin module
MLAWNQMYIVQVTNYPEFVPVSSAGFVIESTPTPGYPDRI